MLTIEQYDAEVARDKANLLQMLKSPLTEAERNVIRAMVKRGRKAYLRDKREARNAYRSLQRSSTSP